MKRFLILVLLAATVPAHSTDVVSIDQEPSHHLHRCVVESSRQEAHAMT